MKPLPTVVAAYADLLQHEQKLRADKGKGSSQSVALAAYGNQSGQRPNAQGVGQNQMLNNRPVQRPNKEEVTSETGLFCRYCKMTNHNINDCWRLKRKNQGQPGNANARFAGAVNDGDDVSQESQSVQNNGNANQSSNGNVFNMQLTGEEFNKLRFLLQGVPNSPSPSPSPPHSPRPSNLQDDWLGKTK
ncbi:unnamed protein product [Linum trigynum]|uniref:Uncharacterized protein n=1 Tax=Linum trigynum TaxID=586398 RepID=A0AAV2GLW1_9ROSI